ncbi:hypothetical protein ACFX2C_021899 [Malus domestica]
MTSLHPSPKVAVKEVIEKVLAGSIRPHFVMANIGSGFALPPSQRLQSSIQCIISTGETTPPPRLQSAFSLRTESNSQPRRAARNEEVVDVLPHGVDDDRYMVRHSHMKYELKDTPGLGGFAGRVKQD